MSVAPAFLLAADWPAAPPNVRALTTLRAGGVSVGPYGDGSGAGGFNLGLHVGDDAAAVAHNRLRLLQHVPAPPLWLEQVHGIAVFDAAAAGVGAGDVPLRADASFAARAGVVCAVQTADCLPVLLCDAAGSVVGAAHAGWRGLAGGVLEATVAQLRRHAGGDILAWLGPAIGPQSFEVGAEVRAAFVARTPACAGAFAAVAGKEGKYLGDLYALARIVLAGVGVTRVAGGELCTMRDVARFYSFRRDGVTGRMASLIWLE